MKMIVSYLDAPSPRTHILIHISIDTANRLPLYQAECLLLVIFLHYPFSTILVLLQLTLTTAGVTLGLLVQISGQLAINFGFNVFLFQELLPLLRSFLQ